MEKWIQFQKHRQKGRQPVHVGKQDMNGKLPKYPPVNAQSLELVKLGFLRVDLVDRNQIQSEVRSRSGPDRCIWHTNRGKSNQASNQSMSHQSIHQIKSINHGTSFKTNPSIKSKYKSTHQVSFKSYQSTCQPHIPINYPTYHCTLTRSLVSSNLSKITSSTPTPLFIFWHFPHYNLHSLSLLPLPLILAEISLSSLSILWLLHLLLPLLRSLEEARPSRRRPPSWSTPPPPSAISLSTHLGKSSKLFSFHSHGLVLPLKPPTKPASSLFFRRRRLNQEPSGCPGCSTLSPNLSNV